MSNISDYEKTLTKKYVEKITFLKRLYPVLEEKYNDPQLQMVASVIICDNCQTLAITYPYQNMQYCSCGKCGIDACDSGLCRIFGSEYGLMSLMQIQEKRIKLAEKEFDKTSNEAFRLLARIKEEREKNNLK